MTAKEISSLTSYVLILFSSICFLSSIYAGNVTTCRTPNGKSGDCVSIDECSTLRESLSIGDAEAISFLGDSACGDGGSLVCCGPEATYQTPPVRTRQPRPKTPVLLTRNRLGTDGRPIADRTVCGYMTEDRILNGMLTQIDEFPWMAILQYTRKDTGAQRFLCGGTLIGPQHILTAAHCVSGQITRTYQLSNVRLGEYNLATTEDCVHFQSIYTECSDPPVDIPIERVMIHPDYNEEIREKPNDIALIKLSQEVIYSDFIRPICLPTGSESSSVGDRLVVAGWGRTETASSSAVKLKLFVPITSKRFCRQKFKKSGAQIRDTQICAGGEKGRDSCTGDSGGPLMTRFRDGSSQWYIEGIVSFGTTCGTEGWPAVYTKVNSYLNWIDENVN